MPLKGRKRWLWEWMREAMRRYSSTKRQKGLAIDQEPGCIYGPRYQVSAFGILRMPQHPKEKNLVF